MTQQEYTKLRDQVRKLFSASGMSQAELARRSGVSQSQISHYLSGKRDLGGESIDAILKILSK